MAIRLLRPRERRNRHHHLYVYYLQLGRCGTQRSLTVTEDTHTDDDGVTSDTTTYDATVTLTDNGDGTITTPAYPEGGLVLTNTYEAEGTLKLEGTKAMSGRNLTADDHYTLP